MSWAWWYWPLTTTIPQAYCMMTNHWPSVLWRSWLGHVTHKIILKMTIQGPGQHGTVCHQKEMATYRHWSVSLWQDRKTQTMSHVVLSCPLTNLNGGLSRLHSADEDAVLWLTSYGSWHAYEKKKTAIIRTVEQNWWRTSSSVSHIKHWAICCRPAPLGLSTE